MNPKLVKQTPKHDQIYGAALTHKETVTGGGDQVFSALAVPKSNAAITTIPELEVLQSWCSHDSILVYS
jgi:hypothetical protein